MMIVYRIPKLWTSVLLWLVLLTISYAQKSELFKVAEGTIQVSQSEFIPDSTLQRMEVNPVLLKAFIRGEITMSTVGIPLGRQHLRVLFHKYQENDAPVYKWTPEGQIRVGVRPTVLYSGRIEGEPGSLVYAYASDGKLYGTLNVPGMGSFDFGPAPDEESGRNYVLIHKSKIRHGMGFSCMSIDDLYYRDPAAIESRIVRTTCKEVRFSIHADYDLYQKLGSNIQEVVDYVKGIFHGSAEIYRKEGIHVVISEIVVHTVEDGLPHSSANDDLWKFKSTFKQYNGDLSILLSGYEDGNGNPSLGGTAYTNSLCIKSYSYAYGNVEVNLKEYPSYSWDVHVFTHEIGHILGSPHTHDCVWGPKHDEPIDGCYLSNGCGPGPIPTKGTIMSYCHLPGRPGVDFSLGFGQEPGDKIRAKIESSSCLRDYIPGDRIPEGIGVYHANIECSDGTVVHYYNDNNTAIEADDVWLLTIDTYGEDIGHVGDPGFDVMVEITKDNQVPTDITADYVPDGKVFHVINRYWKVRTDKQPNGMVKVSFPFLPGDFDGLSTAMGGIAMSELEAYKIESPGSPNPKTNHAGANLSNYFRYTNSSYASGNTWNFILSGAGYYQADFEVNHFSGGGMGAYSNKALAVILNDFQVYIKDREVQLNWSTPGNSNAYEFEIQRSGDGVSFYSIARLSAMQDLGRIHEYHYTDKFPAERKAYYRLKMMDLYGTVNYSAIKYVVRTGRRSGDGELHVIPNPITRGYFDVKLNNIEFPCTLRLYNSYGKVILERELTRPVTRIRPGEDIASGVYWVMLISHSTSLVKTVMVY